MAIEHPPLPKRRPTRPFGIKPIEADGTTLESEFIYKANHREYADDDEAGRAVIARVIRNTRLLGYATAEIADIFGVSESTVDNWRKTYPALQAAWTEGGTLADTRVARAMFKRAVGYQYPEQKGMKVVPPDPAAGQYWLNNRQPQLWKTASQVTGRGGMDYPPPPSIHVTVVDSPPRNTPLIGRQG